MIDSPALWSVAALVAALLLTIVWAMRLRRALATEQSRRHSLSTRYGLLTEQFLPLAKTYPWNPANFRFLGSPVDGIQFEDDQLIIVEFKAGGSQLTSAQRRVRDLVAAGKVRFEVVRVG